MNIKVFQTNEIANGLQRISVDLEAALAAAKQICDDVRINGDEAVLNYARKFDKYERQSPLLSLEEMSNCEKEISRELKEAMLSAFRNIRIFHEAQIPGELSVETAEGVICQRLYRPIQNVGLYIPGGTAVLPSTVLMLGVPAMLAGCGRIAIITPASKTVSPSVIYAAKLCGITEIYAVGGAQGVAMLGYGTNSVKKVDKIFGPGSQIVTAAKMVLNSDPCGCAIDMPAGPSEVLIIADSSANPAYIAADMLSQLEHGIDSQAVLLTDSQRIADETVIALRRQISDLPRQAFAEAALKNSVIVKVSSLDEAFAISNQYAPEHLILNLASPRRWVASVQNAGSVFLGQYSPESAGDYASGTNHSLPTSGYAKSFSGVTVESFMKSISVQELTLNGLRNLSPIISALADEEGLAAHKKAVTIRLEEL